MCDVLAIKAYNEAKLSCYAANGVKRVGIHAEMSATRCRTRTAWTQPMPKSADSGSELHELKTAREVVAPG